MRFNIGKKEERLSSKSETQIAIQSKKNRPLWPALQVSRSANINVNTRGHIIG